MNSADREKLLARIKALFSKTTEAGATEAEELAATEKARELIEKYQLDMGAEELKREGFVKKKHRHGNGALHVRPSHSQYHRPFL